MTFEAVLRKFAETFGSPPPLSAYRFRGSVASATFNGIFVAENGLKTGNAFTGSVATSEVKTLAQIAGFAIPDDAVGVVFDLSANVKFFPVDVTKVGFTEPVYGDFDNGPTMVADVSKTLGKVS